MEGNIPTDIVVPIHLLAIRRLIQKQLKVMIPESYLNTFELELKFLRTFLNYTAKRGFEYQNLEDLMMRSEAVDRRARSGQDSLISIYDCYEFENAFYNTADHVLDEIKLLKPEIGEVHRIVSRSSQSHNCMSNELLIEFIYSLLENLKDLISFKVDLVDPLKIKLESLEGKLRFLRTFLLFVGKTCTEHEKLDDLFIHAKVAADNAASLSYSCLVDKMDEEKIHTLAFDLSDLARKMDSVISGVRPVYLRALKASSVPSQLDLYASGSDKITVDFVESLLENVRELLRVDWTVPMRDQIEILQEELTFLRSFLTYLLDLYTDTETLSHLLRLSQAISSWAASVVYSLYDNKMSEETAENVYSSLVDLLEEIKVFKEEIPKIYLKSSWPNLPRTDELGFFDSFLGDLRGMLKNRTGSIECLDLPIEPLLEDLQVLRSFLGKIAKQRTKQDKLKVLWTQIIDVAYKAEYIIDLLLIESSPIWHLMPWISEVRKYIEFLKAEVNEIGEIKLNESEVHHGAKISGYASLQPTSPEWDDISVGFEDEEEKIVDVLVRGSRKLEMVSIVGMPGLGKTHLAKKIYNNLTVKDYFHVRAWCFVSQLYNRKYLLTRILSQVAEPTKEMSNMEDEELAAALYRSLRGKRYLILMDDLWDVEA